MLIDSNSYTFALVQPTYLTFLYQVAFSLSLWSIGLQHSELTIFQIPNTVNLSIHASACYYNTGILYDIHHSVVDISTKLCGLIYVLSFMLVCACYLG